MPAGSEHDQANSGGAANGGAATDSKPPDAASAASDGTRIDGIPPPRPGSPESAASQSAKDGPQNGARHGRSAAG